MAFGKWDEDAIRGSMYQLKLLIKRVEELEKKESERAAKEKEKLSKEYTEVKQDRDFWNSEFPYGLNQ